MNLLLRKKNIRGKKNFSAEVIEANMNRSIYIHVIYIHTIINNIIKIHLKIFWGWTIALEKKLTCINYIALHSIYHSISYGTFWSYHKLFMQPETCWVQKLCSLLLKIQNANIATIKPKYGEKKSSHLLTGS